MSTKRDHASVLELRDLTVTLPTGHRLLREASLKVAPGQLVLLVGPSGSGKSTLLRLIAGLDNPLHSGISVTGTLRVDSSGQSDASSSVGLVFQNHALFDELNAAGNVQIALDHRAGATNDKQSLAEDMLNDLHVAPNAKPAILSGGERQRVAVARTLAMDPAVLLFDEPTTGLDPGRARAVSELIIETHQRSGKTVVIVTHDYAPFLRFNPRLVLLDARTGKLRDVSEQALRDELAAMNLDAPPRRDEVAGPGSGLLRHWRAWVEFPGEVVLVLLQLVVMMFGGWTRPRWKLRYLWLYARMVALGTTALYVAIAGIMLGFVFVIFSFAQLPFADVTVPLLMEEFLAATGYSTFRVIVPLMIAVLIAGKCGASIAADVGTRRYAHQLDAMRNCGVNPDHYLYGSIGLAMIVGVPLLTIIAYVTNCYASLVAFLMSCPEGTVAVFRRNYFATLWPEGSFLPTGTGWLMIKMTTSGYLMAGLSYAIGARPKSSPVDVSRDVGLTIFWASLGTLLLHSLYSQVEF